MWRLPEPYMLWTLMIANAEKKSITKVFLIYRVCIVFVQAYCVCVCVQSLTSSTEILLNDSTHREDSAVWKVNTDLFLSASLRKLVPLHPSSFFYIALTPSSQLHHPLSSPLFSSILGNFNFLHRFSFLLLNYFLFPRLHPSSFPFLQSFLLPFTYLLFTFYLSSTSFLLSSSLVSPPGLCCV